MRERSLHARLKNLYAEPGDRVEEKVEGYWVDIRRGDEVIEIQTGNFAGMKRKLAGLLESRPVRVVHPVAAEKWITRLSADGSSVLGRRKSPKRGTVYDLFDELVSFPQFFLNPRFSVEVVLIKEEELRCEDGRGSWRRKGVSIRDHLLLDVAGIHVFRAPADFLKVLPPGWRGPSTNNELARDLGQPRFRMARMTYCLDRMGLIRRVGKQGNAILFERAAPG